MIQLILLALVLPGISASCTSTQTLVGGCCKINAQAACTETGADDRCIDGTKCTGGQCLFKPGATCPTPGTNAAECADSLECGTSAYSTTACIKPAGGTCESSGECKSGTTCALNASGVISCIVKDGEACTDNSECAMMRTCGTNLNSNTACVVAVGAQTPGRSACPKNSAVSVIDVVESSAVNFLKCN